DGKVVSIEDQRQTILDACTGRRVLSKRAVNTFKNAVGAIPVFMSAYNLMWINPKTRTFIDVPDSVRNALDTSLMRKIINGEGGSGPKPELIPQLTGIKFSEAQRAKGHVNVWDYIMLAQLYAFDFEQQ